MDRYDLAYDGFCRMNIDLMPTDHLLLLAERRRVLYNNLLGCLRHESNARLTASKREWYGTVIARFGYMLITIDREILRREQPGETGDDTTHD